MPTSICSFIINKHAVAAAAAAAAPPVIVYNPFDDDAVVNYFLVFRKELRKAERKAAKDAAITYLLNNGVGAVAVNRRLHVGSSEVTRVKAGLALAPRPLNQDTKVTLGIERRADDPRYAGGAKRSEGAGYVAMSFDLAAQIRADPNTNMSELAPKYNVSENMVWTIRRTASWTRPAAV